MDERGRSHLALVLVDALDRRSLRGIRLLGELRGEARALHIAVDRAASHELAAQWMNAALTWLPLHIEEPVNASVAQSVRAAVVRELLVYDRVSVVVPEMDLARWWQPLLHRGRGRVIAWALRDLAEVNTIVVPVPLELTSATPAVSLRA